MEKQTKHRILGIFVIIGLVITLLPLFQSNKELATQTALIKTPPFPNQSLQSHEVVAVEKNQSNLIPPVMENMSADKSESNNVLSIVRPSIINQTYSSHIKMPQQEKQNSISLNNPVIKTADYKIVETNKSAVAVKNAVQMTSLDKNNNEKIQNEKYQNKKTQAVAAINTEMKSLLSMPKNFPIDDAGLLKLKSTVWVIQIGSFKNKENALRIVNQLRANGYRAFFQQKTTAMGINTRVFVGPEHKKTSARALADRLQSEMHIQGIIVSYKPLTL